MPDSLDQLQAAEEEARLALALVETDILPTAWLELIAAYRTAVRATAMAEVIDSRKEPSAAMKREAAELAHERGWVSDTLPPAGMAS